MKRININESEYEVVENYNEAIDNDVLEMMITDYFERFDYIFGDWAYGKLRLKGYYDSGNKNVKNFNDVKNYKKYVEKYCAYGCRYFLIKRV